MQGINAFIKANIGEMVDNEKLCYISPNIDPKKLKNAINAFNYDGNEESILAIIDTSLMKSGKEGALLTGQRLIWKDWGKVTSIELSDIQSAESIFKETKNDKGKVKTEEAVRVACETETFDLVGSSTMIDYDKFAQFLNTIANDFDSYEEQAQMLPIADLDEKLKLSYLKIIVNMAFDDDGEVDDNEFTQLLELMSRLKVSHEGRMALREYMADPNALTPESELIQVIDELSPDGMRESIHISIAKDLIHIHSALTDNVTGDFDYLNKVRSVLTVGDDEIELAVDAIKNDKKILDREYTDDQITASIKDLSAKAAAVGVPLGAVYLSGSVMGISAAGMTSGLATLGFGGALGLSSMATGIGAAVVLGVVAYRGVKKFTQSATEEGDKRRELMLQDVIRQGQKTMHMIIEDVNSIVAQLNDAMHTQGQQTATIDKLKTMMQQHVKSMKNVSKQNMQAEANKQRLKSPEVLDIERLEACTDQPATQKYREMVLAFYAEEEITETDKNGQEIKRVVMKLQPSDSDEEMEKLGKIFETIEYHSGSNAAKQAFKGLKGKFS